MNAYVYIKPVTYATSNISKDCLFVDSEMVNTRRMAGAEEMAKIVERKNDYLLSLCRPFSICLERIENVGKSRQGN